jgi:hypothetical protein
MVDALSCDATDKLITLGDSSKLNFIPLFKEESLNSYEEFIFISSYLNSTFISLLIVSFCPIL